MKTNNAKYRNALLAKIHIAIKALGISDDDYRLILAGEEFGVDSAAKLSDRGLSDLVGWFEERGWRPKVGGGRQKPQTSSAAVLKPQAQRSHQVDALKDRARQMALHTDLDMARWRGLVRKACGVDELEWCGDAVRLKRLLAMLKTITDRIEPGNRRDGGTGR